MFDTSYKNMKCIQDFVGNSIIVEIVVEYNVEIMCPLLFQLYNHLTHVKELV